MSGYARPSRLREALQMLARSPRPVLAGGTDFYPAQVGRALPAQVLDITGLRETPAEFDDLACEWFAAGPVEAAVYVPLVARFERCRPPRVGLV